jgi:hypothetical protein
MTFACPFVSVQLRPQGLLFRGASSKGHPRRQIKFKQFKRQREEPCLNEGENSINSEAFRRLGPCASSDSSGAQ